MQSWQPIMGLIAAVLGLPTLYVAARVAYRALRASRLKRPVAFELPAIPDASAIYSDSVPDLNVQMAGRDRDTDDFVQLVNESSLVFLKGDSGTGKSTFLKLGLGRDLYNSGQWLPVYVDSWRSDWGYGPWMTLFDALSLALTRLSDDERKRIAGRLSPGAKDPGILFGDPQRLFDVLRQIRPATGRRPVILLDQIDTYIGRFESNLVMPDTNRSLIADELCNRNDFWAQVRDACQDPDPVHCIIAARSDSSRIECFQFGPFHSRPLPNLSRSAAFELIQKLGKDAVTNPENGFEELSDRLARRLAQKGQSVLAIELRVVLAGLASPNRRLTPGQLKKAGGTDGLAAEWLSHQIEQAQLDQREVLSLLLRMVDRAQRQTVPVPLRELHYAGDLNKCLQELEQRRVLRVRFRGSSEEEWQLYHSYLAGAVLGLEQSLAKWRIYLERADQEFREAPWTRKWACLIPPMEQVALFWNRARGRVCYGEHAAFARISAARLVANVPTVAALLGFFAWSFWSANTSNERLLSKYESEATRQQALWELAAAKPAVKIDLLGKLSSRPAAVRLLDNRISAALGLRSNVRDAAQRLLTSSQACDAQFSEGACVGLATFVDRPEVFASAAQQVLDRLKRDNGVPPGVPPTSSMGEAAALAVLARGSPRDFAGEGAQTLLDLLKKPPIVRGTGFPPAAAALANLARGVHNESAAAVGRWILEQLRAEKDDNFALVLASALASLGPKTQEDFAGPAAQQIFQRLEDEKNDLPAAEFGIALASLVQKTQGDLAERGAQQILGRLNRTNDDVEAAQLGGALAVLAKEAHGHSAFEGAVEILDRLGRAENAKTAILLLGRALAALAKQAKGDFAAKGARQMLGRLAKEKGDFEAAQFAEALALLADGAQNGLAAEAIPLILARLTDLTETSYSGQFANALTSFAGHNQIPVLVDFLKWPVSYLDRNRVIEKILKLEDVPPERFGFFDARGNYTAHLWQFADWARTQKDVQGHPLDIDSPPVGPQHLAERFGSLFPK